MYLKERRIVFTLISTILIFAVFALYVYQKYINVNPEIIHDFQFWGKTFLIFIPVMIVAQIIIHIILFIVNKIITDEDIPTISDEMDKLIELKALRIARWSQSGFFVLAMATQAIGMQPWVLIIFLIVSCFITTIVEATAQIYFYKRGV